MDMPPMPRLFGRQRTFTIPREKIDELATARARQHFQRVCKITQDTCASLGVHFDMSPVALAVAHGIYQSALESIETEYEDPESAEAGFLYPPLPMGGHAQEEVDKIVGRMPPQPLPSPTVHLGILGSMTDAEFQIVMEEITGSLSTNQLLRLSEKITATVKNR